MTTIWLCLRQGSYTKIDFEIYFLIFHFDIGKRRTLVMGNGESTYDSHDDFFQQPYSYATSSGNTSYHEPSSYAESSVNTTYQHKQLPTYIADNFSSLDQVFTATFAHYLEKR